MKPSVVIPTCLNSRYTDLETHAAWHPAERMGSAPLSQQPFLNLRQHRVKRETSWTSTYAQPAYCPAYSSGGEGTVMQGLPID